MPSSFFFFSWIEFSIQPLDAAELHIFSSSSIKSDNLIHSHSSNYARWWLLTALSWIPDLYSPTNWDLNLCVPKSPQNQHPIPNLACPLESLPSCLSKISEWPTRILLAISASIHGLFPSLHVHPTALTKHHFIASVPFKYIYCYWCSLSSLISGLDYLTAPWLLFLPLLQFCLIHSPTLKASHSLQTTNLSIWFP